MHRFYINSDDTVSGGKVLLVGDSYNHIKNVLRLNAGDEVTVSDGAGTDYACVIDGFEGGKVSLTITDLNRNAAELPLAITLYQGMPKGDKLELVIEKAVELGAVRIVPVMMERTVVKLDDKKKENRLKRYRLIAESAGKQSGRGIIPEIPGIMSFEEAVKDAGSLDRVLVPYEDARGMAHARSIVKAIKDDGIGTLGIFIGPEGGFAKSEIEKLEASGALVLSLGSRILRTETAGLTMLSIIGFETDKG